jgi:hypothetical protein
MGQSLGQKIDQRCGPQFGPDKSAKRRAPLKEVKRGRTASPTCNPRGYRFKSRLRQNQFNKN